MIRRAAIAAALSLWAVVGWADEDGISAFAADDREMNNAIAQAQQSLPLFLLNTVDAEGYGPQDGYLKVRFEVDTPDADTEIIWIGPFAAIDETNFIGLLANQPIWMAGLSAGDQVAFTYDMIVDWSLPNGAGQSYGNYTTRVIFEQMPDDEGAATLATFSESPFPPAWENAANN